MSFVVDNSVVSGWYIKEQATPYTAAILDQLKNHTAHAPALWRLELANVARTSVIRGKFSPVQAADAVALITKLPIIVDRAEISVETLLVMLSRCRQFLIALLPWHLRPLNGDARVQAD